MINRLAVQRFIAIAVLICFLLVSIKSWMPTNIYARYSTGNTHTLAVIIPYRGVFGELQVFIPHMESFLNNQSIRHKFLVIRQADSYRFNKGSLINIGYLLSRDYCDYLAIHDIDTLPLNPKINYHIPREGPRLLSPREYHPVYNGSKFSGGIILITMEHFKQVGGMTNEYWGWGGEDNEFYTRMQKHKLKIFKTKNLSTDKSNTFLNLHDLGKRPRDTERFDKEKKNVFKHHKNSGYSNINYKIKSTVDMTISEVPLTVYNVHLHCDENEKWCR